MVSRSRTCTPPARSRRRSRSRRSQPATGSGRRRRLAEEAVSSGRAAAIYARWIAAQGGDPRPDALPVGPVVRPVPAPASGYVQAIATEALGRGALHLGAGRARKEDAIDHAVGVICHAKRGDRVEAGEPLADVHASGEEQAALAVQEVAACYRLGAEAPAARPIVLDVLT